MKALNLASLTSAFTQKTSLISYIPVRGVINSATTQKISFLLNKVPKRTNKLVAVITSNSGCLSQSLIIAEKFKAKAKQKNIQFITFGEQFVLNSAFLLLMSGDKVFVDRTTVIGGLENGHSKINPGIIGEHIRQITYAQADNLATQQISHSPYSEKKSAEMKQIFQGFSKESERMIRSFRGDKIKQGVDLASFYNGNQARQLGLIDGIGRINQTMPKLVQNYKISLIQESKMDKLKNHLSKIKIQGK